MASVAMTKRSAGYVVPASEWNQLIDNDEACAVAQFTTAGDIFYGTGSRAGARLALGTRDYGLFAGASAPEWGGVMRILAHSLTKTEIKSSVTETNLWGAYTLAANRFPSTAELFYLGYYYYTNTGGSDDTFTLKFHFGASSITLHSQVITTGNSGLFRVEARVAALGATNSQDMWGRREGMLGTTFYSGSVNPTSATVDTTSAVDIKVTGQHTLNHANCIVRHHSSLLGILPTI